jgi:hypothetical protein
MRPTGPAPTIRTSVSFFALVTVILADRKTQIGRKVGTKGGTCSSGIEGGNGGKGGRWQRFWRDIRSEAYKPKSVIRRGQKAIGEGVWGGRPRLRPTRVIRPPAQKRGRSCHWPP